VKEWADNIENVVDSSVGVEGQLCLVEDCYGPISSATTIRIDERKVVIKEGDSNPTEGENPIASWKIRRSAPCAYNN
jgi:hypothetical protein